MKIKQLTLLLSLIVLITIAILTFVVVGKLLSPQTVIKQDINPTRYNSSLDEDFNKSLKPDDLYRIVQIGEIKVYHDYKNGFEVQFPKEFQEEINNEMAKFANDEEGWISVRIFQREFNPDNIQGLYGKIENAKIVPIGSKTGYQFFTGDAGCGGEFVQTGLGGATLEIYFGSCEDNIKPIAKNTALQANILSSFRFTK